MKIKLIDIYSYIKNKLFKVSIFFSLAVVMVGGITLVELPCPVCDGTGYIKGAKGLEITDIVYELVSHEVVGLECGWDFERYTYDVEILVDNASVFPTYGMVEVTFHDPESTRTITIEVDDEDIEIENPGGVIAASTIFVDEIAAGDTRTIGETIVFDGIMLEQMGVEKHLAQANTSDQFTCPFHGEETTKVPFTEWLRLRW
jgi:hypothetical protein